jgi:chemotaxis protein CheD
MEDGIVEADYLLAPGHMYVAVSPTLIRLVLGSCVAVSLWERNLRIGAMNHFIYPFTKDPARATAKYGNVAVPAMISMMIEYGAAPSDLEAQIFGGATPEEAQHIGIGQKNTRIARLMLEKRGINVISEDVGGFQGRKIVFDTYSGKVAIIKVPKIRMNDWFPDPDGLGIA